ncbi:MAG TPA: hypothetical protein EYP10_03760 [Armatimonadetes bacterium]|nr:hypothetical protein [Armatimonadota bacterium]
MSGAYGTGKSHLMALFGLLCKSREAQKLFAKAYPIYEPLLHAIGERSWLVVYISLDAYSAPQVSLEQVLWRETLRALKHLATQRNRSHEMPALPDTIPASRADAFNQLQIACKACGCECILWLIDELAMFLSAKSHRELQHDASFLQFIGQYAHRSRAWIITAIQKTLEDIGELEPYSLTQIKDRYHRHTLSFAHTRELLHRNLIAPLEPHEFRHLMNRWHRELRTAFPLLDFSAEELTACYPLHPFTVTCLERATAQFFSRTRSVVEFIQTQLSEHLDAEAFQLLTPNLIYEHFLPDILTHPDLHAYGDSVVPYFEQNANELLPERPHIVPLIAKALVVFKIAGLDASVRRIAHTFLWDTGLGGEMNYSYILSVLETLRMRGNYIETARREEDYGDVYVVDVAATLNEMLRRRLQAVVETLTDADQRIVQYAWECCESGSWVLPPLEGKRSLNTEWLNTQRSVAVQCADLRELTYEHLCNLMEFIASSQCPDDLHLFIGLPLGIEEQLQSIEQTIRGLPNTRWRNAIAILIPRELTQGELVRLRENTAARLLLDDPTLRDSEAGMALWQRLRQEQPARMQETQRIMRDAYLNGTLIVGDRKLPISALVTRTGTFADALTAIANSALPKVYPQFIRIAPKMPLRNIEALHRLVHAILAGEPLQGMMPEVQELWRMVALPMGLGHVFEGLPATSEARSDDELLQFISNAIIHASAPMPYAQLCALVRKSEYGLTPALIELTIATLLRRGDLTALDANDTPLPLHRLKTPFEQGIASLVATPLIENEIWHRALEYASAIGVEAFNTQSNAEARVDAEHFARASSQQRLWHQLLAWKRSTLTSWQDCKAQLMHLRTNLQHSDAQWRRAFAVLSTIETTLSAIADDVTAGDGLQRWVLTLDEARIAPEQLSHDWLHYQHLHDALRKHARAVLRAQAWLMHPELKLPPQLEQIRAELLLRIDSGEALMEELPQLMEKWQELWLDYVQLYMKHHQMAHSDKVFEPYIQLRRTPAYRFLTRLLKLHQPLINMRQVLQSIAHELNKQCPQTSAQLQRWLLEAPVCPQCRLQLGEQVSLTPVKQVMEQLERVARIAKERICASGVRKRIENYIATMPSGYARNRMERLMHLSVDDDHEMWLSALTDDVLEHLNAVLFPTAPAVRTLEQLTHELAGRVMTKTEAVQTFVAWLDQPSKLQPRDKIKFVSERLDSDD